MEHNCKTNIQSNQLEAWQPQTHHPHQVQPVMVSEHEP